MSHVVTTPLTWEADPFMCPRCAHEMRIVSLIDDPFPDYDTEPVLFANG